MISRFLSLFNSVVGAVYFRRVQLLFFGVFLALSAGQVSAVVPASVVWGDNPTLATSTCKGPIPTIPLLQCAMDAAGWYYMPSQPCSWVNQGASTWRGKCTDGNWGPIYRTFTAFASCPANSTSVDGACVCTPPAVEDATHTSCIVPAPDVCASGAGLVSTYNVTAGYSRSVAGAGLYPPLLPDGSPSPAGYTGLPPESMCIAGCKHSRGAVVGSWTSLEPTVTGLYRQSDDWSFTSTPTSCVPTASDNAALNPDAAVPSCAGFLGQINGKISCVASVGSQNTDVAPEKRTP